ncbi:MAG: putative Ig domain-containing protein [Microcoleaceae cyanobacterium]
MPDNFSTEPNNSYPTFQPLTPYAGKVLGELFNELLPLVEPATADNIPITFDNNGLEISETGLEVWSQALWYLEEPTDNQIFSTALDPITGLDLDLPTPIRLQGEDMELSGDYQVEDRLIRLSESGGNGTAQSTFTGTSGLYNIIVKARGGSEISLELGGEQFDWKLDSNSSGLVRQVLAQGVTLNPGDVLSLSATRNGEELAEVDYIELVPVLPNLPLPFRIEAEDLDLENYQTTTGIDHASGGEFVTLSSEAESTGKAEFTFSKPDGNYDVIVGYYDESDGEANFTLNLEDTEYQWQADQDLGSTEPGNQTLVRETVLENVSLSNGEVIELSGTGDGGDLAGIDYIEFIPTLETDETEQANSSPSESASSSTASETEETTSISSASEIANSSSSASSSAAPVTLTPVTNFSEIGAIRANSTKLWSVEGRGGGISTYEFAIGPSGAQADLHEQAEHVWQNGEDVPWSLEWQGDEVVFTVAGESISYPIGDSAVLNTLSLLTKVNTQNGDKVSPGTSMSFSVEEVNGETLSAPISLTSTGVEQGQDLDALFLTSDGEIANISGIARLSWLEDGVNPHSQDSHSHVTFKLSGYQQTQLSEPPTGIDLSENQVRENSAGGTIIGQLSTQDPDSGESHRYTLVDDANGRFEIVDNELRVKSGADLDFEDETEHEIQVRSTDPSGQSVTERFTIEVIDENEAPKFTSTPAEVDNSEEVYTYEITATDPDAGDKLSFSSDSLPEGLTLTDNGDGTALLKGKAAAGLHNIELEVQDSQGLSDSQSFTLQFNQQLRLQEGSDFFPTEQVSFTVPDTPSVLRFTLTPEFDTTDPNHINDAIEVAILNDQGESIVHTLSTEQQTILNWTEGEEIQLAPGVRYDSTTGEVEVNLVGLPAGQEFDVMFRLVNNDEDSTTQVIIEELGLIEAPQGMTAPVSDRIPTSIVPETEPNFNSLEDVSESVEAVYRFTHFNEETELLSTAVQLQNQGSYSMDAPLLVTVTNISDPQVEVQNPDGYTPEGLPYYDFSHLVNNAQFNPNELTETRNLVFYNPNQTQFEYDLVVLSEVNQGPYITSEPNLEVLGGQIYTYEVEATDPNGDSLTYQLLSAPDGMTIDSETGVIDWDTDTIPLGNYSVVVEVSDNRGETALQQYSLSLTDTPNRPPIFTSTPEVDAWINQLYSYDADAIDPDSDDLVYGLIIGPEGMTVDPLSGQVEWTPPPVLTLGDTVLGQIRVPGEQHEFQIPGQVGQQLYFDPLQYTGSYKDWNLKLYSPSGKEVSEFKNANLTTDKLITLTENGNYRLVLDAEDDRIGNYGFSIIDLDLAPHVELDTEVKGTLAPGSEDDIYRFSAQKGQHLFLDDISNSGKLKWQLYDPYGNVVPGADKTFNSSSSTGYLEVTIPHDGDYILALKGKEEFTDTVEYAFEIITPDTVTQAIEVSSHDNPQQVKGNLAEKGEVDLYTFTGVVGQRIYLDQLFLNSDYYKSHTITISSPTGKEVLDWTYNTDSSSSDGRRYDPLPITLTEAGTYEIKVDASNEYTGEYSFSLLDLASATPIAPDQPQSGVLDPSRELHLYQFTAKEGARLYFDTSDDIESGVWTLFSSGNEAIEEKSLSRDIEYVFETDDTYTLAIRGTKGEAPVNYGFELISPETNVTPLTLNQPVTAEIGEKGEQDIYTFTGSRGQRLFLDNLIQAGNTKAELLAPSGKITGISNNSLSVSDWYREPFFLSTGGEYQLVIDGAGEPTEEYSFQLLDLDLAPQLPMESLVEGMTLNPGTEVQFYQITGQAGQRLYFDSQQSDNSSYWHLYSPGLEELEYKRLSNDFEVVLPSDGTYYLMLQGYSTDPVDYQLQVVASTTTEMPLTLNQVTIGNISKLGQQDEFIFEGTQGQMVYLDARLGSESLEVTITNPSGNVVFEGDLAEDGLPITLNQSGSYTVTVDGDQDNLGEYGFVLVDDTLPLAIDGTPVLSQLAAQETVLYSISGTQGQQLQLDSLLNTPGATWTLYIPSSTSGDATVLESGSLSEDLTATLPIDGEYILALSNESEESVNYQIQLNDISQNAVVNDGFNIEYQGDTAAEYTLKANAGTLIFFDGIQGTGSSWYNNVSLYNPDNTDVFTGQYPGKDLDAFVLEQTGDYRLSVNVQDSNDFTFTLLDLGEATPLELNTTVTPTVPTRETIAYKFSVEAGQEILIDSIEGNGYVSAKLFDRAGRQLLTNTSSTDSRYDNGPLSLQAGEYYLTLSNSNNATEVEFQVLNLAATSETIQPQQVIDVQFDPKGIAESFTVSGQAGERLYFDSQKSSYGNWSVYTPDGELLSDNNLDSDFEIELPVTGEYRVVLNSESRSNSNFSFQVFSSTTTTTPIDSDNVIEGSLTTPGQQNRYTFDVEYGQQLYFDSLTATSSNIDWQLISPSGKSEFSGDFSKNQLKVFSEAGTYTLIVDGVEEHIEKEGYRFQVLDLENSTQVPVIPLDEQRDGNFDAGERETDIYRFSAEAGQYIYFNKITGENGNYWILRDQAGNELTNSNNDFEQSLPYSGDYFLEIVGADNGTSYTFELVTSESPSTQLVFGQNISSKLTEAGEQHFYHFEGTPGQILYFDSLKKASSDLKWQLLSPTGEKVFGSSDSNFSSDELQVLDEAGTYTLVIDGVDDYVEEEEKKEEEEEGYQFRVIDWANPDHVQQITLDSLIQGDFGSSNLETDFYRFDAQAGEYLYFDRSVGDYYEYWTLYNSAGEPIEDSTGWLIENRRLSTDFELALPYTGEYFLRVSGNAQKENEYEFKVVTSELTTEELNMGTLVDGRIAKPGDQKAYTFEGTVGQLLHFDTLQSSNLYWRLLSPSGQEIFANNPSLGTRFSSDQMKILSESGQYTLIIDGHEDYTDENDFRFQVSDLNDNRIVTKIDLDTTINGTFEDVKDSRLDQVFYQFSPSLGTHLYFNAKNLNWKVYNAVGTEIKKSDFELTLSETGDYFLQITGASSDEKSYEFQLLTSELRTTALTLNEIIPEESIKLGEQHTYTFTGTVGQQLYFDSLTYNGLTAKLYDPYDNEILRQNLWSNEKPITLTQAGDYRLVIDGTNEQVGSYQFKLSDLSLNLELPINQSISKTLAPRQTHLFQFNGDSGTVLSFDLTDEWSGADLELYDPSNRIIASSSSDDFSAALPTSGLYTIAVINDSSSKSVDYDFSVTESLPEVIANSGFDDPQDGFVEPGSIIALEPGTIVTSPTDSSLGKQSRVYSFTGNTGTRMLFNGMKGSNVRATLYNPNDHEIFDIDSFDTSDSKPFNLTLDGTYHLVIKGETDNSDDYQFQLMEIDAAPAISFNLPTSGVLETGRATAFHTFSGTVGQRLYFNSLTDSSDHKWELIGLDNTKVKSSTGLKNDFEIVLPHSGEYSLRIMGGTDQTTPVNYEFEVLTPTTDNTVSIITPGTGESGSNDGSLGLFPVKLLVEDGQGGQDIQEFNIRLWPDPDNANPFIVSTPEARLSLAEPGYIYQVEGIDSDNDELSYRLVDSPLGALMNQATGELLWFPESDITAGDTVEFTVEVLDGRGGKDTQTFSVEVYDQLGTIQGLVFDDLNGDGYRGSKLFEGDSPEIVFAIDVSGSTGGNYVDWTTADLATVADEPMGTLGMELATAIALSEQLIVQGHGETAKIAVVPFNGGARILDMNPATDEIDIFTTPLADNDQDGVPDIRQVLNQLGAGGGTNFTPPLEVAEGILSSTHGDPNLIFLSDGFGSLDTTIVDTLEEAGFNINAFGIGAGAGLGQLQKIDPDAIRLLDPQEIIDLFQGWDSRYATEPLMDNVTVYLDLNNNGSLDENEPAQLTGPIDESAFGEKNPFQFSFENLLPGEYTVRQIVPSGFEQTVPVDVYVDTVTVGGGEVFSHLFGNHLIEPVPNQAPTFITESPTESLTTDHRFSYQAKATDLDADSLSYDLPLAPAGMIVDPKSGAVVWQPSAEQVGTHSVILRVKDGEGGLDLQAFEITVTEPNQAPRFTSVLSEQVQPQEGKTFTYDADAIDANGDPLSFSLIDAPSGVTIDADSGLLSWTPNALGVAEITIQVSDGKGGEDLQTLELNVIEPIPNRDPVINSGQPRSQIRYNQTYLHQFEGYDPDGDALSYTLVNAPEGMRITKEGLLTWIPGVNQTGSHEIEVEIGDGNGGVTPVSWSVNVSHQAVNHSPVITSVPDTRTNLERGFSYHAEGTDSDGDTLLWDLDAAPDGMIVDPFSGQVSWTPTAQQIGNHTVQLRATDIHGAYSGQAFELQVTGANTPPSIVSQPLTQGNPDLAYRYNVVATDPEQDELSFSLGVRPEGMQIDPVTGEIAWTPNSAQVGSHAVEVLVTDTQGGVNRQVFNLGVGVEAINHPPSINSTPVFQGDVGTSYSYTVEATDPDEIDHLSYRLIEAPTGVNIDETGKLTWENPVFGNHKIVIGVEDSQGLGTAQGFTLTVLDNSAPVIQSTPNEIARLGQPYQYDFTAFDPDNQSLSYSLDTDSIERGMTIDELGRLRWTPDTVETDLPVTITVTDPLGASVSQSFDLSVVADNQAPSISLNPSWDPLYLGQDITFYVNATDNVGVANLQLLINDEPVALNRYGQATLENPPAGEIVAKAIATDAAGNITEESITIPVIDDSDNQAPIIEWNPIDGVITSPIEIFGTVQDDNLSYYSLSVAPLGSNDFQEVFRNTESVTDGVLATFDPTLLANDAYTLRFTAGDVGGNEVFLDQTIDVGGDLKLGNFTLSFTDLEIPLSGIPINVTRTYDSLNANTTDDFGYGWRMEFRDTDLRTNVAPPSAERQLLGQETPFHDGARVYVTLPGGKRTGFTFKPKLHHLASYMASAGPEALWYQPEFIADDGSTLTLSVKGSEDTKLVKGAGTNEYFDLSGSPFNPASPRFGQVYVLTTKEGIEYEIDAISGDLLKVIDTNGNTLTYSDEGIVSSTGQEVTFKRDAQNRINAVVDPEGNEIRYNYDANGDLISVTDREENTTQLEYHDERDHYLDKIIDPLGREGVKAEYDENGRLSQLIDVNGEAVELVYDPDNSVQTVKDVFDNPTTYEYDSRGNVVQEIDALGGVTLRTYDDQNNLLTETDADGVTTSYTYDEQNNLLSMEDGQGNVTRMTYNKRGQATSTTTATGLTVKAKYNDRGNLVESIDADGLKTTYTYSAKGQLLSQTAPDGQVTEYSYDAFGNPNRMVDSRGNEVMANYSANGRLETANTEFELNGVTYNLNQSFTHDDEGRIITNSNSQGNGTSREYNELGQIVSVTDVLGNITTYQHNKKGEVTQITLPDNTPDDLTDNPVVTRNYDIAGRIISETSPTGLTTRYVYDKIGRLVEVILPDQTPDTNEDNPRIKTEYTKAGRIKSRTDIYGNQEHYQYNDSGQLSEVKDILGNTTTYTYNLGGQIDSITDSQERTTRYIYDDKARVVQIQYFDDSSYNLTYDELGRVQTETNELGQTTTYEYDAFGQIAAVINAGGEKTQFGYDDRRNLIKITDALGHSTHYRYDEYARQVETQFHDGKTVSMDYDSFNRLVGVTDENTHTTAYSYDNLNQITQIEQANGSQTGYTYDTLGRLTQTEDANGHATQFEYDAFHRETATILPLNQRNQVTYDNLGQVSSTTDFNGDTITYTYDSYGRLKQKDFSDSNLSSVSYTYDPVISQLLSVTDGRGKTQYSYDELDRLSTVLTPDGQSITYNYDLLGNITSLTTQAGSTNYTYNNLNQLDTVSDGNELLVNYDYDVVGNLTQTTFANGSVETRQYDKRDRLTRLTTENVVGTVFSDFQYTFDGVGNRTQVVEESGRTVNYTYDALNRLTEEAIIDAEAGNRTIGYTYDREGNRLTRIDSVEGTTQYIYDNNDRLKQTSLGEQITQFDYDNNGSLISRITGTDTVTYNWANDGENRLIEVEQNQDGELSLVEYVYDASGRRVATITDGDRLNYLATPGGLSQVALTYDEQGQTVTEYTYGLDLIHSEENSTESFYHTDALGSTRLTTDGVGLVTGEYTYDAFGRSLSLPPDATAHQFAGEQRDSEIALDYLRARYYDPELGRFISKDPFSGFQDDPYSQHDYQYAHANPVNFVDPTGYFSVQDAVTAVSTIGILASIGSSAGYVGQQYVTGGGISGAEGLEMFDQWVAGYGHGVSGGMTTAIRREDYGDIQQGNHAFLWNMGNLAGVSTSFILGFRLPGAMAANMGGAKWGAAWEAVTGGYGAIEAGRGLADGNWEYSDVFNLLSLAPYALPAVTSAGKTLSTLRRGTGGIGDDVVDATRGGNIDDVLRSSQRTEVLLESGARWQKEPLPLSSSQGLDSYERYIEYAPEAYKEIRNSNDDVTNIARNTGWPEYRIRRIKRHLFENTHQLDNGISKFDPDPEIADSWGRLQRGQFNQEDIRLLKHEYFESKFESIFKTDYRTAHDKTIESGRTWNP